jgi:hypothetical protein
MFAMHLAPGTTLNNQGSTRCQMQAFNFGILGFEKLGFNPGPKTQLLETLKSCIWYLVLPWFYF